MDELCHDKRKFCHDRQYQEGNTSKLRQVFLCCDKVFNIKPTQGRISIMKNINSVAKKKKNMKGLNSLSRQDAEKQHQKNGNKETYCCDIIKS